MTREEIASAVSAGISDIQRISGQDPVDLKPETDLLSDLPDFDSLKCVELEVLLNDALGANVEGLVFPRTRDPKPRLTLEDVVNRIFDAQT